MVNIRNGRRNAGLVCCLLTRPGAALVGRRRAADARNKRPEALSQRELDVLRLLARGLANKEISRDLGIAEKTVKTHVSSIFGELGVQSGTQAALYAGRVGVVPVSQLGAEKALTNARHDTVRGGWSAAVICTGRAVFLPNGCSLRAEARQATCR